MELINYYTPMRFGCFLLLSVTALAPFGLRGAGWKACQEASQSTVRVNTEDDVPGVAICEAISLAGEYLTENHIDMPLNCLQSVELIDIGNIKKWKILWKLNKRAPGWGNDRVDAPPIGGVYVKMDRTVDLIDRQVIFREEPRRLPASHPEETAILQGTLTYSSEGLPLPDILITLRSKYALWQTITDECGRFQISRIAPGDYLFKCSLPGFETKYRILHLQGDEIRQLDLMPNVVPTKRDVFTGGIIEGYVYINDKIPFPGVKVTAEARGFSQTAISMENGEFRLFGLEEDGTYNLHFSHEGFQDITETYVVGPGIRPKTEIHFIIPWLCALPDPARSRLEARQTQMYAFDWQTREKDVGTVLSEKYLKDILAFERLEIAALIPVEKIDLYLEYFEKGIKTDIGISIIEGEEHRWLETAESSGSQRSMVFKQGYDRGSLNASLGKNVDWKAEWRSFITEGSKYIVDVERRKVEALMDNKKINAYIEYFELGLNSDTGRGRKMSKKHARLATAFRYGFHYQQLFEKGYREGLVQSAGDPMKYMKKIE